MGGKRKDESGFSLLELMFAAGVLALAVSFLFGSMMTVAASNSVTESRIATTSHETSIMEELRGLTFAQFLAYIPPAFSNAQRHEVITVRCFRADGTAVALPASPVGLTLPNPLRVECQVSWVDSRGHAFTHRVQEQIRR